MEFRRVSATPDTFKQYAQLFAACFPTATHLNVDYLRWLYRDNPDGNVVGFDAFDGDRLAAHYVCIPAAIYLDGKPARSLLSLNTATHPNYQGKGLFTRLADMTYAAGAGDGFRCVYGVANANSTPGFVRKLGFQLVAPLKAMVGIGSLRADWNKLLSNAAFRRSWSPDSFRWRCSNPINPLSVTCERKSIARLKARAINKILCAYGEIPLDFEPEEFVSSTPTMFRLFLGLFPSDSCGYPTFVKIPDRFRPSPLNLIFKPLNSAPAALEPQQVLFSFADFDAY